MPTHDALLSALFIRTSDGHVLFHHCEHRTIAVNNIIIEAARRLEGIEGEPPPESPLQETIIVEWAAGAPAWEAFDEYRRKLSEQ
jgi:hypothetical protein